jgi:hypothetical protein
MTYDATVRNIELIGEAAARLPEEVRQADPQFPWRLVIAARNRLIHGYLDIDDDVLWNIIQTDLPVLLPALRKLQEVDPGRLRQGPDPPTAPRGRTRHHACPHASPGCIIRSNLI